MVTDFQEKLRQIRAAKDRETQERLAQTSASDLDRLSLLESRFVHRENVEKTVQEFAGKFIAELPAFAMTKSFFEGKYRIELKTDDFLIDETGRVDKFFSRLTFLLDPAPAQEVILVSCKKTVRNRDQESASTSVPADDAALAAFRGFVEEHFVLFANEYFSSSHPAPTR